MVGRLFDFNDPFFRPIWLRIVLVALAAAWGIFEFVTGSPFWGVLFCGMAAFAFYGLFIAFDPREPDADKQGKERRDG